MSYTPLKKFLAGLCIAYSSLIFNPGMAQQSKEQSLILEEPKRIVIDAGHSERDSGAISLENKKESLLNVKCVRIISDELSKKFNCILTRDGKGFTEEHNKTHEKNKEEIENIIEDFFKVNKIKQTQHENTSMNITRAYLANESDAPLISIHHNSKWSCKNASKYIKKDILTLSEIVKEYDLTLSQKARDFLESSFNGHAVIDSRGIEVYIYGSKKLQRPGTDPDYKGNEKLARALLTAFKKAGLNINLPYVGLIDISQLAYTKNPGCLIETGFIANPFEEIDYSKIAKAVKEGLNSFYFDKTVKEIQVGQKLFKIGKENLVVFPIEFSDITFENKYATEDNMFQTQINGYDNSSVVIPTKILRRIKYVNNLLNEIKGIDSEGRYKLGLKVLNTVINKESLADMQRKSSCETEEYLKNEEISHYFGTAIDVTIEKIYAEKRKELDLGISYNDSSEKTEFFFYSRKNQGIQKNRELLKRVMEEIGSFRNGERIWHYYSK